MKQFKNLYEAFNYQPNCPICNDPIEADYKEIHLESTHLEPKVITTFNVGSDEISIDYYDNTIISYKEKYNYKSQPSYSGQASYYNGGTHRLHPAGTSLFKTEASCGSCSKYGFIMQMHVRLDQNKLVGIFLNSESVSIEEPNGTLHEIKNIYAIEKTEYNKFARLEIDDGTVKASGFVGRRNGAILFPLMPLDLKNPDKLLQRIKNLIIYT